MKFVALSKCRLTKEEQRVVWAVLEAYKRMPEDAKAEVRALTADIAETIPEKRALFDMLTRGTAPEVVSSRTGISTRRLYKMRVEFYERFRYTVGEK